MLNKIILIGRLTKDVDLRHTPGGDAVANFTLAVDRNYKNKNGEKDTDFFKIVCWRKLAETCANNCGKGRLVAVAGRLQTRTYEDQNGQRKYITEVNANEVTFLDWPKGNKENKKDNIDNYDLPPAFDDDNVPF